MCRQAQRLSTLVLPFPLLQSNQEFHEDLFPDCAGMLPATDAQSWWAGDSQQVSGSQEESLWVVAPGAGHSAGTATALPWDGARTCMEGEWRFTQIARLPKAKEFLGWQNTRAVCPLLTVEWEKRLRMRCTALHLGCSSWL